MSLKAELQHKKEEIWKTAKKYGVLRIQLFGSAVKDRDDAESDIDLLVQFEPGRTLFDLINLEDELKSLLERPVDVVTEKSLNKYMRSSVLKEAVEL